MQKNIDLSRFTETHRLYYPTALREIRSGRKENHWMWYIFPQLHGLGVSPPSKQYAIRSIEEAAAFLRDPYLGGNLIEISRALLTLPTNRPRDIFYPPDDKKLRSCMTLFAEAAEDDTVFRQVLAKFYGGKPDTLTLDILKADQLDS